MMSRTIRFAEYMQLMFAMMGAMILIGIGFLAIIYPSSFKYQYLPLIAQASIGGLLVSFPLYLLHKVFRRKSKVDMRRLAVVGCVFGIVFGLIFVLDETARTSFGAQAPVRPLSLSLLAASVGTLVSTIASERKAIQPQGG